MPDNITVQRALEHQAAVHSRFRLAFQKSGCECVKKTPLREEIKRESGISILSFATSSDVADLAIPTEPMERDTFVPRLWKLGKAPWEEEGECSQECKSVPISPSTIRRVVSQDFPLSYSDSEGDAEAISPTSIQCNDYTSSSSSPTEVKPKPIHRLLRKISQMSLGSSYNLAKELAPPTGEFLSPDCSSRSPSKSPLTRLRKFLTPQDKNFQNTKVSVPVVNNTDKCFVLPVVRPLSSIIIEGIPNKKSCELVNNV